MDTMDINSLLDRLDLKVGLDATQLQCLATAITGFRELALQVMEYPEKHADFVKFVAENANFQLGFGDLSRNPPVSRNFWRKIQEMPANTDRFVYIGKLVDGKWETCVTCYRSYAEKCGYTHFFEPFIPDGPVSE